MFLILAAVLLTSSVARAADVDDIRLAVLPLTNGVDAATDYFADAMTEEIGASLTGIPNLHVIARVSAFKFKGKGANPIAAGRELGATHLIEGSASKMGDRIRLTLRLVSASDGGELWRADYDRSFRDVFDVEDAIARAVLQTLYAEPRTRAVRHRTSNMNAYDEYLRAQPLIRGRGRQAFAGAAKLLEDVAAADPDFEPALSLLAFDYDIAPLYDPSLRAADTEAARKFVQSVAPRAEMLATHAAELDPSDANAYLALAYAALDQSDQLTAEDDFQKALQLDPDNANALHGYSQQLAAIGRIKESLAMRLRLQALESAFINYTADTAEIYWLDGQSERAIRMLDQFRPGRTSEMAQFTAAAGRNKEAASLLREMPAANYAPGLLEAAAHLLETAVGDTPPDRLPKLGNLGWIYLHLNAPERVMEYYESNVRAGYFQPISTTWFWHPSYAAVRKLPRFKQYMRDIGMVAYWRARGWPPSCHPVGSADFACQ
jgi:TolB-like protein